jgi:DNA gyrase inhibitor GyrI
MGRATALFVLIALVAVPAMASWAQDCGENLAPGPDTSRAQTVAPPEVQLRVDTAFAYCAIEMKGSYDQHSAAFEKLYAASAEQGVVGGYPFGVYYNSPSNTPADSLRWNLGFRCAAGQALKSPLVLKNWPYKTMAVLDYSGEFGGPDMVNAYTRLYTWIGTHGYRPAGPMMEEYLNAPSQDEKGFFVGRMNIVVPVEKAPPAQGKKAK